MSGFPPVFLPPGAWDARRASMTFLRLFNQCPRSGFLYVKHRGIEAQNVEMVRGSALHLVVERATREILAQRETEIPPELVKAIVNEVLAEMPVPVEEHDYLRESAYRWGEQWKIPADERVVAVERLFVLELAGWRIRCKVDFATADATSRLYVADYKSGRGAPAYEKLGRVRPDVDWSAPASERIAAKAFQLVVYVLALAFGRPAVACPVCMGEGEVPFNASASVPPDPQMDDAAPCGDCGGTGERLLDPVLRQCPEAIAEYVYPGIEDGAGLMLRRTVGMTRLEMLEYRESLEAVLARLSSSIESGDWPAVVSDAACGECPAPGECPIPASMRDLHGSVNTLEEAQEALVKRHRTQALDRAMGKEIRKFMEQQLDGGPIRYGGRVAELVPRESTEVRDREKLMEAIAGGMPVDEAREKFIRIAKGVSFAERDLGTDELDA